MGGLDREPEILEVVGRVGEELLRGAGLAVEPAEAPHTEEEQRAVVRIGDMRQDALEQAGGLLERRRSLGFVRGANAGPNASSIRPAPRGCRATTSALPPFSSRASAARVARSRFGNTTSSAIASWSACRQL